jgi:hypothetical protein
MFTHPWTSLVGPSCAAGLRVVPLDAPELMIEEALGTRIAACRAGRERYFSIRDETSGERLAVLGLARGRNGRWTAIELKGPSNSEVSDLLVRLFASWVAASYDRADRQAPRQAHVLSLQAANTGSLT